MSVETLIRSDKELAMETLRRMWEDVSLQEISEELAILSAIRKGEVAADAGRLISHEEVKQRSVAGTTK